MQHFKRYILILFFILSIALAAHSYAASVSHILISVLAFSILGVAAIQALVITLQNYVLKHYPLHSVPGLQLLPPVQTMQNNLFKIIWAGFIFLSLSFVGAFLYLPHVLHTIPISKLVLSSLAWCLFATLLYGYHRSGWRQDDVTARTLGGVVLLIIAYFGSKWVELH